MHGTAVQRPVVQSRDARHVPAQQPRYGDAVAPGPGVRVPHDTTEQLGNDRAGTGQADRPRVGADHLQVVRAREAQGGIAVGGSGRKGLEPGGNRAVGRQRVQPGRVPGPAGEGENGRQAVNGRLRGGGCLCASRHRDAERQQGGGEQGQQARKRHLDH